MVDFANLEDKLSKIQAWLSNEFSGIRAGRATPALIENVMVEAYGVRSPLKSLSNIGVDDARTLRVSPYDAGRTKEIEKAINDADLGVSVQVNGSDIRVIFPELTGERREELLKMAKSKLEEARVRARVARDETKKGILLSEKNGEISEDEMKSALEKMQDIVDEANKRFDEMFDAKKDEIAN